MSQVIERKPSQLTDKLLRRFAERTGLTWRDALGLPPDLWLPEIAGGSGAKSVPVSAEGYQAVPGVAGAVIPFAQASKPIFWEGPKWTGIELSESEDVRLEAKALPANGYLRALYILVETETAGEGGEIDEDGPWSLIRTIECEDQGGHTIHGPLSGYNARQACKWGGYFIVPDPANWGSYSNSSTSPKMTLFWHPEVSKTGAGSLTNMTERTNYHARVVLAATSSSYKTKPTKAPKLRIRTVVEEWPLPVKATEPEPGFPEGRAQEQRPPMLGMIQRWTAETKIKVANEQDRIAFKRMGQQIRAHVLVARTNEGVRSNSIIGDPVQIEWAGNRFRTYWQSLLWDRANAVCPNNKTDTGVYPFLFNEGEQIFAGANEWNGWLSTVQSTAYALNMPNFKEGLLDIITCDIATGAIGEIGRREMPGATSQPEPRMVA